MDHKTLKIILTSILFAAWINVGFAALFKDSVFEPVDDDDLKKSTDIDDDLKGIIRQVVQFSDGEALSTALIVGNNCSKAVTAKHNIYDPDTGSKYIKGGRPYIISLPSEQKTYLKPIKEHVEIWSISDEGGVFELQNTPKSLKSCKKIPVTTRSDISKSNYHRYTNCRIIGFPIGLDADGYSANRSAIRSAVGFYPKGKRGIAKCSLKGITKNGVIKHNCSATPGISGGAIACKVSGEAWSVVAINDGDLCDSHVKKRLHHSYCYNESTDNQLIYQSGRDENGKRTKKVIGRAGSFDSSNVFD